MSVEVREQNGKRPICSYEWYTNDRFLVARLFPDRIRIIAHPVESADDILDRIPAGITHLVLHINCTNSLHFIEARRHFLDRLRDRGISTINGQSTDISKRRLQAICLNRGLNSTLATEIGDPDEVLILKTDRNAEGSIERLVSPSVREQLRIPEDSTFVKWLMSQCPPYPILPRREIPAAAWHDNQVIVERFIANAEERFYRVHVLHHLMTITEAMCPGVIKKLGATVTYKDTRCYDCNALAKESIPRHDLSVIEQVQAVQRSIAFDFAGLDVLVDSAANTYVVDINTTPFAGETSTDNVIVSFLRRAIA